MASNSNLVVFSGGGSFVVNKSKYVFTSQVQGSFNWESFFYSWWLKQVEAIKDHVSSLDFDSNEIINAFNSLANKDMSNKKIEFEHNLTKLRSLEQRIVIFNVKDRYEEQIELLLEGNNEVDDYYIILDYLEVLPARFNYLVKDVSRFAEADYPVEDFSGIIICNMKEKEYIMSKSLGENPNSFLGGIYKHFTIAIGTIYQDLDRTINYFEQMGFTDIQIYGFGEFYNALLQKSS
jgi:hypothetical protein